MTDKLPEFPEKLLNLQRNLSAMGNFDQDKKLLKRLRKGDRNAFDELFRLYYAPLCVHAAQYVDDSEAENIVQDLMLHLWEKRRELSVSTSLRSYLFISARNRALTLVSRSKIRDKVIANLGRTMDFYFLPPSCPLDELMALFDSAMKKLPDDVREAFEKSRIEGKTYKEIAQEEGVTVKVVDHRIQTAVKFLRQEFSGLLPEPG